MLGLTNKYIENLMLHFDVSFKGVFSSDNIPFFSDFNISLLCNFSKSNEKGTHYVSIYILRNKIIYFDPLGFECVVEEICNYLNMYNKIIIQSTVAIQHPLSFHCGYFCIGFLLAIHSKLTLLQYQSMFDYNDLLLNDEIVCNLILQFMK